MRAAHGRAKLCAKSPAALQQSRRANLVDVG
jgi:hypothetical protein